MGANIRIRHEFLISIKPHSMADAPQKLPMHKDRRCLYTDNTEHIERCLNYEMQQLLVKGSLQ